METIYTAEALSTGAGRDGHVRTTDGRVDLDLAVPTEMGGSGQGTNPEQLFAAGYAACFQSAIGAVARRDKVSFGDSEVTAEIGLARDGIGYALSAELKIKLPGLAREQAQHMIDEAHKVCPYSRAVRGNMDVKLTLVDAE